VKVSYSDGSSSPNFGYEVPVAVIEDYMYCPSYSISIEDSSDNDSSSDDNHEMSNAEMIS